jgi:hypothetical protein
MICKIYVANVNSECILYTWQAQKARRRQAMNENKVADIINWLEGNVEIEFEDNSFSHEFGTQEDSGLVGTFENCPYTTAEITEAVKEDDYMIYYGDAVLVWDSSSEVFLVDSF